MSFEFETLRRIKNIPLSAGSVLALTYAIASRAALLGVTVLSARYLEPEAYGHFALFAITVSGIAALSTVGVGVTCNSISARHYNTSSRLVSATLTFSLLAVTPLTIVFSFAFSAISPLPIFESGQVWRTFALYFPVGIMMAYYSAFEGVLYGLQRYREMALIALVVLLCVLSFSSLAISFFGLLGAIAGVVLYRLLGVGGFALRVIGRAGLRPSLTHMKENQVHVKAGFVGVSLPVALAGAISGPITALAIGTVAKTEGAASIGAFSLMYQLFLMAVFPAASLSHFMLSRLSAAASDKKYDIQHFLLMALAYGLVAAAGLLISVYALSWLTPNVPISRLLAVTFSMSALLYSVSTVFLAYWPATGNALIVFVAQLAWAVAIVSFVYILSSKIGADAIALGFLAGSALQFAVHFAFWVRRERENAR